MNTSRYGIMLIVSTWFFWLATQVTGSDVAYAYGAIAFFTAYAGYLRFEEGWKITEKNKAWALMLVIFSGIPTALVLFFAPQNAIGAVVSIITLLLTAFSTFAWLDFFDQVKDFEPKLEDAEKMRDRYKRFIDQAVDADTETVDFTELEGTAEYSFESNDYRMEVQTQ